MMPLVDSNTLSERDSYLESFRNLPQKELFLACRDDPAVFAFYMLGIRLYAWQWLVSRSIVNGDRRIILNTSRQVGKSFFMAIMGLWYSTFNKAKSSDYHNTKVGIISATEQQSKKVMGDIKNLIYVGDAYCKMHYSKTPSDIFAFGVFSFLIDDSKSAENNKSAITFKSWNDKLGILLDGSLIGSFIKSYPPTDIVRGETFDLLIIDEAAQIDDDTYYMAITKTGDKYDAIRIIASTPFGQSGFYYELFDPSDVLIESPWMKFKFTIDSISLDDPADYGRRLKDIKFQVSQGKVPIVRQEYYCEFVHSEQSFFDPVKVDNIFEDYTALESYTGGLCDLGIDFGGLKKSQTVITISNLDEDGIIRRLFVHSYAVREDGNIIEDVEKLCQRFSVERIIVDECPEGDHVQRKMLDKGWNVIGFKFGSEKVKKFGEFRAKVNKGKVKSFKDAKLQGEMKALMVKQGTERTKIQPPPGYSDDFIDSFIISSYFYTVEDPRFRVWDIDEVD